MPAAENFTKWDSQQWADPLGAQSAKRCPQGKREARVGQTIWTRGVWDVCGLELCEAQGHPLVLLWSLALMFILFLLPSRARSVCIYEYALCSCLVLAEAGWGLQLEMVSSHQRSAANWTQSSDRTATELLLQSLDCAFFFFFFVSYLLNSVENKHEHVRETGCVYALDFILKLLYTLVMASESWLNLLALFADFSSIFPKDQLLISGQIGSKQSINLELSSF